MREKKELTETEKRDLAMKYEVAEELGLLEKVERCGWRGLTSRESGRIGGIKSHAPLHQHYPQPNGQSRADHPSAHTGQDH